ncbi:MAG: hypothetical protein KA210_02855 [Bacteroidia bacterium]|nr:hypothetical protein [Bacteroidia bacterium]
MNYDFTKADKLNQAVINSDKNYSTSIILFMKQIFSLFFILIAYTLFSQVDTLNRYSNNGKKDGVWKVFLNQYLIPIDSSNAYFFAYERYDNGQIVFEFYRENLSWKDFSFKYSKPLPKIGYPEELNGRVECFEPNGEIMFQYDFHNGFPIYYKYYQYYADNPKKCGYNEIKDWSKKYNDLAGSYYYQALWDGKLLVVGWFKKDKKKWKLKKEKIIKNTGLLVY